MLEWEYKSEDLPRHDKIQTLEELKDLPDSNHLQELLRFSEIGYAKGIQQKLQTMKGNKQASAEFIELIEDLANGFQFERIIQVLGRFK